MIKAADLWPGLLLLGLGIYILANVPQWTVIGEDGPGPGLFPLIEGIAIVALSVLLIVISLSRRSASEPLIENVLNCWRSLATWAALMVSALLLNVLGFLVSFGLLTLFMVTVMYQRSLLVGLAVAFGSSLGFYLFFTAALGVRLPIGMIGF